MITFRSSKVVYYGPHACGNCGKMIVKMGTEFGGNAFDQPDGPIYPNTEWHVHVCDTKRMKPSMPSPPDVAPGSIVEVCALCGEPMPKGEEMFNYHGYSGPCPKPAKTPTA